MLYKSHRALVFITTMKTTVAKKKKKGLPKVQTFGRGSKTRGHNFFLWSRINADRTGVGVCVE